MEPERYEEREFIHSPFVEIKSDEYFDLQMQYPLAGMEHAETGCYVRQEVYEKLVLAAGMLPPGFRLRIWDAWRPFLLQEELYFLYSKDIIRQFGLESSTEEEKRAVIHKFVSEPVDDREVPPAHTTGGAVDLTIIDKAGRELAMGSLFDEFSDRTCTAYFEDGEEKTVKDNRRMLYHIMTEAGFTNLPSEWWHFDYGDRFWAFYRRKPAIYRGVFTKEELYETIR